MKDLIKKNSDKAFNMLTKKGFEISEKLFIKRSFVDEYIYEFPFIATKTEKSKDGVKVQYFYSEHKEISNLRFNTKNEVILANAIFENVKDRFNPNEFVQMLKFTFRILQVNSDWI